MTTTQLNTTRFYLREIEQPDIRDIHKGLSDKRVTQYYAVHFPTLEATQEQMDWFEDLKRNGTGFWWGVYDRETERFCGAGGFNNLDKTNRKAEIGFWLLPQFWGKGIMTEVMPILFQAGFDQLHLNRIEGFVDSRNSNCKKALRKIHFTYEGTMQECEVNGDEFLSVAIYAILKKDYEKLYTPNLAGQG